MTVKTSIANVHDRFWPRVDTSGRCWVWTACKDQLGYGRFKYAPDQLAHRASYRLAYGEIPAGLDILHQCDNPSCVRPSHLKAGTHQDNMTERNERGRLSRGFKHSLTCKGKKKKKRGVSGND